METNKEQDFFEEEIDDIGEEGIVEYDITTSPRDLTPANIVDMIDSGIIEIPLFQRNYVWDIKKASKLLFSFPNLLSTTVRPTLHCGAAPSRPPA